MKLIDIGPENAPYVEDVYERWKSDRRSVSSEWDTLFREAENGDHPASVAAATAARSESDSATRSGGASSLPLSAGVRENKQARVDSLIRAYRESGHSRADVNPLRDYLTQELNYLSKTVDRHGTLEPESFGLTDSDLEEEFRSSRSLTPASGKLRTIIESLKMTYGSYIGVDILHIQNRAMRGWLIERIENNNNRPALPVSQRREILENLIKAEEFEQFIHSNYIGQKRFSLEGGESLIPALHALIDTAAAELGVQEVVIGMAHRGRLNVLTNFMQKPEREIFSHFEERVLPHQVGASGDVKYHLGFSTDHANPDGTSVHVSLVANPSHLEAVDPVVQGKARGVQRRRGDIHRKKVIPVLIHGESAFTGQGVVAETFNMAQLRGYKTGGTVHIIVNNQIGFTTASRDSRSTLYCTDVAKSMPVPIFHVNGDQPEHVVRAIQLALRFRQKFGYDAVVDIVCYRKYGHNEADDPSFTHPRMYQLIEVADGVSTIFGRKLDRDGVYAADDQARFRQNHRSFLKETLEIARKEPVEYVSEGFAHGEWEGYTKEYDHTPVQTGVPIDLLRTIGKVITTVPDGFAIHAKLMRILKSKRDALDSGFGIDWGTAEALSFGSLLLEGNHIRLSGEDSGRGTFSHRHAVWWNTDSEQPEPYTPLSELGSADVRFRAYDSPLSEYSVLGFEYGNALVQPEMLTIWEAQFGDFCNGAQVIIDQFITAGQSKWDRGNGLVMLLPHGYEGQGPEHSSAHIERFLQLCAEDNIQVCNATTPAQYFHLLRRQMKRTFRKPLVIATPKSLLRHKEVVSTIEEMSEGLFEEVLDDPAAIDHPRRIIFCSGKIYYDLSRKRRESDTDTAIVRIEQLYPFPSEQVLRVLEKYTTAKEIIWAQEESRNRGAWGFIAEQEEFRGGCEIRYVGRNPSASAATGSYVEHTVELESILEELFGKGDS